MAGGTLATKPYNTLKQHVIDTIWCSPEQDNQIMLAPERITRSGGEMVSFPVMMRVKDLPTKDKYYHVYCINQVSPIVLGLLGLNPNWITGLWSKFSDAVNQLPLFCDLYTDKGVHFPLHLCYYMVTEDRALILCVPKDKRLKADLETERVYFRAYTNAYYASIQAASLTMTTRTMGKTIDSMNELVSISSQLNSWRAAGGGLFCYVNGELRSTVDVTTAKPGDVYEVVQDFSIKRVVDLKVDDLFAFRSLVDDQFKYLLHYPENDDQIIDYLDDIDLYVLDTTLSGYVGRYLHRNSPVTHRMVTHRDYSLSVSAYENTARKLSDDIHAGASDIRSFYVRLYIRHSGFTRPLTFDNNRIFEMYKLPDEKVVAALVGTDATVPFLSAQALEASDYIKLMSAKYKEMTPELIQSGFGYNAISKFLGESPIRGVPQGEYKLFLMPPGLVRNVTVFEYDAAGTLLGFYAVDYAESYVSVNKACEIIEVVYGKGSKEPAVTYGATQIPIKPGCSFRVYKAYLNDDGMPLPDWEDVTDTDHYGVENGELIWLTDETNYILMVRTDEAFLCYDLPLHTIAGTLYFDLSEISGGLHRTMPVPMGDLDLWLNGKSLIHTLDSFIDFPRVYIVNKDYLAQPAGSTEQKVTVRFTGFAEGSGKDFHMRKAEDFGFIVHGVLSNNDRYNLRDDKVLRISVKGNLKHRDQVIFSEEHAGVSITDATNGQPYQVKEVIVPLEGLTSEETYSMRAKSLVIDKAISDYMTVKLPQPPRDAVSAIPVRHRLVSPFFSHLINDLQSKQIDQTTIQKDLSDQDVLAICKPYEFLLKFDPISETNGVDIRFVLVHPHELDTTITLDFYSYAFINRVVKLYGRGLVVLAQHLTLDKGT